VARFWRLALWCLVALLLAACGGESDAPAELEYRAEPLHGMPVYRLAIHPLHNPRKLIDAYQPLVDYLNAQLEDGRIVLEASRDYQAYEKKIRAQTPDILLPNPWQTLIAMDSGYRVIAMAGDAEDFKGLILARVDSGIQQVADLRGHKVSYPSPTALAACIMPQYFLHQQGLDVNRDIKNLYVGSQESSIMNVYLGETGAGATWPPPWRLYQRDFPEEAAKLTVLWETEPLMNNSVMVHRRLPEAFSTALRARLLELDQAAGGEAILAAMETARFHPATDTDYQGLVRGFVDRFEREVRPVEGPVAGGSSPVTAPAAAPSSAAQQQPGIGQPGHADD
jgi:phosphonate transport system substrate-binding protein